MSTSVRRRRTTAVTAAVTAVVTAMIGLPATGAAAAPTPRPGTATGPATEGGALTQARRTGRPVPVTGATTPTDTLVANPDGTLTSNTSLVPVRKRVGGAWVDLDATLTRRSDGSVAPRTSTADLILSGGGTGPLATLRTGGRSLGLTWPFALPRPVLSGATATYPAVLPGVDLQLTATTSGGFRQVLVVHDATAAADPRLRTLTLATTTAGLSVQADPAGNLRAMDDRQQAVFTAPAPRMWDSGTPAGTAVSAADPGTGEKVDARTGQPLASSARGPGAGARSAPLAVRVTRTGIDLSPDPQLLRSAVFPLYVDPTWALASTPGTRTAYASVNATYAGSNYWNNTSDPDDNIMQAGNADGWRARALLNFGLDLTKLSGATIYTAQLNLTNTHSYSCTATDTNLYAPATTLTSSNATWNYWFGSSPVSLGAVIDSPSFAHGYTGCASAGVGFNVLTGVRNAVSAGRKTQTFVLTSTNDSGNTKDYKEFSYSSTSMSITYNHTPNVPTGVSTSPATACTATASGTVGDGPVSLYAPVSDRDGMTVGVRFQLWKTSASGTILASTDPNNTYVTSGSTATLRVAESTLKAAAGSVVTSFSWHVQTYDGHATSDWSNLCSFYFDPTRTGAPTVDPSGSATIGEPATFTIVKPTTGTVPSGYMYQLNGGAPGEVSADADGSGNATITVVPTRRTNTLTVTSLSAGGNVGDSSASVFTAGPAAPAPDGDLTGDNLPDLLLPGGTGLPPGLWLNAGRGTAQLDAVSHNVGIRGNVVSGAQPGPADFAGAQVVTGRFSGTGLQDTFVYYPNGGGATAGSALIFAGSADGSPFNPVADATEWTVSSGTFADYNGLNPRQLVNAGNSAGQGYTVPDLIGLTGDASGWYLDYYPNSDSIGGYGTVDQLTVATPDGDMNWAAWTLATAQAAGGTAMYLWNRGSGKLVLWTGLHHTYGGGDLTYTAYTLRGSGFNTNAALTMQAADINNDGTPDLWTTDSAGKTTANLTTSLPSTATITPQTPQTLITANHAWTFTDMPDGGATTPVTATADIANGLTATGNAGATWNTGDLYTPDVTLSGASGYLDAAGPAVSTTDDFTVSLWVKPTAVGGVVLSQDGVNTAGFKLWAEASDSSWRFAMSRSDVASPVWDSVNAETNTVRLGVWTQLTAVYQKSTGAMTLYVNGVNAQAGTHTTTWSAGGHLQIGDVRSGSSRTGWFSGQVGEVLTWTQLAEPVHNDFPAAGAVTQTTGSDSSKVRGDFNGDGFGDLALLYRYADGRVALWTLTGLSGGRLAAPVRRWMVESWGPGIKAVTTGDFNGDGKDDVALFYDYGNSRASIFTLSADANGDGNFAGAVLRWDLASFGSNTKFFYAGDFNGDGKTDLGMFYNYGPNNGHVAAINLSAHPNGDGGFDDPVTRWDSTSFGANTQFVGAGDFNGDARDDLALFYNYGPGSGHVAVFTLTASASGDGSLAGPVTRWDGTGFGANTEFMSSGDFNGDGKDDLGLFYNYGPNSGHVAVFTLTAGASGDGTLASPVTRWDSTIFGANTAAMA